MAHDDRNFYHSFPRVRPGTDRSQVLKSGLAILATIRDFGLVLAPEVISWTQALENSGHREIKLRQSRICFTELSRQEVQKHGETFGPFSIEFGIETLRSLGALPVIYMPQKTKDDQSFSAVGPTVVAEVADVKYTINQLHQLSQLTDENYLLKHVAAGSANSVSGDCVLILQNVDPSSGSVVATYQVPLKHIRDIIQFIGYRNAPFELMSGVLSLLQSLFYPTDNELHDLSLDYYRQREWRLVNGLATGGEQQCRALSDSEKAKLVLINSTFWQREVEDSQGKFRRIDEAYVIPRHAGEPIANLISAVIVPADALEEALKIFGDKVVVSPGAT